MTRNVQSGDADGKSLVDLAMIEPARVTAKEQGQLEVEQRSDLEIAAAVGTIVRVEGAGAARARAWPASLEGGPLALLAISPWSGWARC